MNYKDRLWRAQKHLGKSYRRTRNASNALAANSIFVTAEDRHLVPEARMGCTSVVIPYYADPRRWGASGRAFEQIVAQKRTLLSFVGNIRGKACHLESGACPGDKSTGPDAAARLRSILSDSISRKTNGSVFELQGQSPETHSFADTEALLSSVFCPSPVGDTWTSKRLFTVILALCIPIIVSDHVQLPYERVGLNWSAFSLQVPERDIHSKRVDIVEYARSVPAARVLELQRAGEAQPLITFTPGGESAPPDASSMLLDELHQTRTCMRSSSSRSSRSQRACTRSPSASERRCWILSRRGRTRSASERAASRMSSRCGFSGAAAASLPSTPTTASAQGRLRPRALHWPSTRWRRKVLLPAAQVGDRRRP